MTFPCSVFTYGASKSRTALAVRSEDAPLLVARHARPRPLPCTVQALTSCMASPIALFNDRATTEIYTFVRLSRRPTGRKSRRNGANRDQRACQRGLVQRHTRSARRSGSRAASARACRAAVLARAWQLNAVPPRRRVESRVISASHPRLLAASWVVARPTPI